MSDRVRVWISKSLVLRAAQAVQELAIYRRGIIGAVPPEQQDREADSYADRAIRLLEHDASELQSYGEYSPADVPTEDEQITAMETLLKELEKEGLQRSYYYSNAAANLKGMFRQAMDQRQDAFNAWAALVDNQRVGLRALKLMVERALQCDTHKRKDSTLYVLLDILANIQADLMGIDTDDPGHFDRWHDRHGGSWEMRRLMAENRKLQLRVKALEATMEPGEIKDDDDNE